MQKDGYILTQYHAILTQPMIEVQGKPYFGNTCTCANEIVYARFENFRNLRSFLRAIIKSVRALRAWVKCTGHLLPY